MATSLRGTRVPSGVLIHYVLNETPAEDEEVSLEILDGADGRTVLALDLRGWQAHEALRPKGPEGSSRGSFQPGWPRRSRCPSRWTTSRPGTTATGT